MPYYYERLICCVRHLSISNTYSFLSLPVKVVSILLTYDFVMLPLLPEADLFTVAHLPGWSSTRRQKANCLPPAIKLPLFADESWKERDRGRTKRDFRKQRYYFSNVRSSSNSNAQNSLQNHVKWRERSLHQPSSTLVISLELWPRGLPLYETLLLSHRARMNRERIFFCWFRHPWITQKRMNRQRRQLHIKNIPENKSRSKLPSFWDDCRIRSTISGKHRHPQELGGQ